MIFSDPYFLLCIPLSLSLSLLSFSSADLTYVVQHEGGPIAVLPEDDPPHTPASSVGPVVLSSDKAVLHHLVARGAHPVAVPSPGEDFHPADEVVRGVRVVGGAQAD